MTRLVFGVVGSGPANKDNINDLLCDWLGYGEPDTQGYYTRQAQDPEIALVLPLTDEHYSEGVALVQQWSGRADVEYTGVISNTVPPERREVKAAKREARELTAYEDVLGGVLDVLDAPRNDAEAVYLLILHDPQNPDTQIEQLVKDADSLGIAVFNLSFGLEPVSAPAPEPTPAAGAIEIGYQQHSVVEVDLPEDTDAVEWVFATLDNLLAFCNAADTMNRLYNTGQMSGQTGVLTASVLRMIFILRTLLGAAQAPAEHSGTVPAAQALVNPESFEDADARPVMEPEAVPVEATHAPRSGKTRKEWWDEASQSWRPVGRGRPRKDVQLRDVPVES